MNNPLMTGNVPFFSRRSMAVCAIDKQLIFFGGVGAAGTESILDVANDCWIFDPSQLAWKKVPQNESWPSPRRCVGVAPASSGMYLWGGSGIRIEGQEKRYTFLNDWWHFNPVTGQWKLLRDSDNHELAPEEQALRYPVPRYTPVFQSTQDGIFLFGGYTEDRLGKRKLNDAWVWNEDKWNNIPILDRVGYGEQANWPGLRYGCMSAAMGGSVFVFGGFSDDGDHNDLWRFDVAERKWHLIAPEAHHANQPAARYCSAFSCDGTKLYLFGGRSRKYPKLNFNDLWVFDLTDGEWECVHENRTPHRYDAEAEFPAYHAKSSSATIDDVWYVWGGEGISGHVSDFWRYSFTQNSWQLLQAARIDDPIFW